MSNNPPAGVCRRARCVTSASKRMVASVSWPARPKENMNGHVMKIIRAACDSLAQSTAVSMWYDNIRADVVGRNSPYVTHKDVVYSAIEPLQCGGWRARNSRFDMIFFMRASEKLPPAEPLDDGGAKYRREWRIAEVPRHWLNDLIKEFGRWCRARVPEYWQDEALVSVAVADCIIRNFEWERPLRELAESPVSNHEGEPVEVGSLAVYDMSNDSEAVALWRHQLRLPAMIQGYLLTPDETPDWEQNDIAQPVGWHDGKLYYQLSSDKAWYIHHCQKGMLAEFAAGNWWISTPETIYE